jgi:hypothetical protein
MGLYLYAILNEKDLPPAIGTKGIDSQPIESKVLSPFVVFYSEAQQERYLASRANLLAHEKAIEAVMEAVSAKKTVPLPLQFGLVVEDWEQVDRDLIAGHQDELQALLEKLIGKREVGIKLFWDELKELNLVLEADADLKERRESMAGKTLSMDEAISIGRELEEALEEHKQGIIDSFLSVLQPLSYEYTEGELLTANMLYNAAFLIDWEREPEFAQAIDALDTKFDNRLRIRYNNFTAPFNFVKMDAT